MTAKPIKTTREYPHRRWNPLLEEWLLVSPHRTKRPWQGKQEAQNTNEIPQYDPKCYLCPSNTRANGETNPPYKSVYAFKNDFSALIGIDGKIFNSAQRESTKDKTPAGIVREEVESGECRVVCFSPRHDLTLPGMSVIEVVKIVDMWLEQFLELGAKKEISHIQIFENKGEIMGCSNPHPHCQIWAQKTIPTMPAREIASQKKYFSRHRRPMLSDYVKWELEEKERLVAENANWAAVVPHWAVWPYETLIIPKKPAADITELDAIQKRDWAKMMLAVTKKYDKLFRTSFPYSMGIHQKPTDGKKYEGVILHQHFFPPLLRSATVKKFMVGYEMTAEPQRDILPETAAATLRAIRL